MVMVALIKAVRERRSEIIWRQRDLEPAGAEAAAAEAPAADIEAREDTTDARRSRPRGARRKARAAAEEASEERMLDTRNSRTVLPLWLPLPTASCASSC